MIYGLNFNGKHLPTNYRLKFALDKNFEIDGKRVRMHLVGVGESPQDRDLMLMQATNGRRLLRVVERHGLYAVYAY